MPFQKGNKLGEKAKMFDAALKRAIAQDDGKRVRDAAEKLLDLAAGGERWAVEMLADRLDGKAVQAVNVVAENVEEMSLADLRNAIAAALVRGVEAGIGTDKPGPVH